LLNLGNHQLSTLPGSAGLWQAHWSPDGLHIAAVALGSESSGGSRSGPAILVYDFRSAKWTTLARIGHIRNLTWSSDSRYVYFDASDPNRGMYRISVAAKRIEPLASLKDFTDVHDDWIGVAPDGSLMMMKDSRLDEIYALDMEWP
jgi:Tol biopolymer transport system component